MKSEKNKRAWVMTVFSGDVIQTSGLFRWFWILSVLYVLCRKVLVIISPHDTPRASMKQGSSQKMIFKSLWNELIKTMPPAATFFQNSYNSFHSRLLHYFFCLQNCCFSWSLLIFFALNFQIIIAIFLSYGSILFT